MKRTLSIGFSIADPRLALARDRLLVFFFLGGQSLPKSGRRQKRSGVKDVEAPVKVALIRKGVVTDEITVAWDDCAAAGAASNHIRAV